MQVVERRSRAMGSELQVLAVGNGAEVALDVGERRVRQLEQCWSHFLSDSEVSQVNRRVGQWTVVSSDTFRLFTRSSEGCRLSGGLFQPLVTGSCRQGKIQLDVERSAIRTDAPFDPSGIGKGLAADLATDVMLEHCAGALVSIGGDLRVVGEPPSEVGWSIAVEDPTNPSKQVARVRLLDGAVVTSSTRHGKNRGDDGNRLLHVVDPQHGCLLTEDLTVTVVAGEAWIAEVFATAALVAGESSAIDLLDEAGLSGLSIGPAGLNLTARLDVFA